MIQFNRQHSDGTHSLAVLLQIPRWLVAGNAKRSLARRLAPALTDNDLQELAEQRGHRLLLQPSDPIEDDIPF